MLRRSVVTGILGPVLILLLLVLAGCTAAATPTPSPTQTPPPTATPLPTATPVPSATPTPLAPPEVGNVRFAPAVNDQGLPVGATSVFPPGSKAVNATWEYSGFRKGDSVTFLWLSGSETRLEKTAPWDKADQGTASTSFTSETGIAPGTYQFRIMVNNGMIANYSFRVEAPPTPTPTARPTNTPAPVVVATPAPPPSRGRIAYTTFTADPARGYEIYVMNADGSGSVKLCVWCSEPSFSPDGSKLVFYSWLRGGLYSMSPTAGSQATKVHSADAGWPIWSPLGDLIAFTDFGGKLESIGLIKPDGTGLRIITSWAQQATWSPDGKRLVFKGCDGGQCGLWTINADGTGRVRITTNGNDSSPDWSPDGSRIAFGSNRDGNWEIYTMKPDGTGIVRITNSPNSDGIPVWSPDGSRIVFRSDRSGVWAVYVMNADGSGVTKLVDANVQLTRWDWERLSWTR